MDTWSKEKIWDWYGSRPWIRGCNFMSSDCANRIDQWQEYGFEKRLETADRELAVAEEIGYNSIRIILEFEVWDRQHDGFMRRLDKYLETAYKHGIDAMVVLANDCCVPKSLYKPVVFGEQHYDVGYHGGRKSSPHAAYASADNEERYHPLDEPEIRECYYKMVKEIITEYAHDERVLIWNLFNEPGNNRGNKSLPYIEKFFEIARAINPMQPLCADTWNGVDENGRAKNLIEQRVLELSDVVSFHGYEPYNETVDMIANLKKTGKPLFNTEWLHRIAHNTVQEIFPLMYLEKIACYNWGFVAGKYQTYEPWESVWQEYEKNPKADIDFTKWQHDLIRPSLRPYDPRETEIIKRYCDRADRDFERENGKKG